MLSNKYNSQYDDVPGNFDDPADPAFKVRKVGAYSVWSAQGSYTGLKAWTFVLGIRDILNAEPPYTNAGGSFFFQSGYDVSYVNPLGRFVYGRVSTPSCSPDTCLRHCGERWLPIFFRSTKASLGHSSHRLLRLHARADARLKRSERLAGVPLGALLGQQL